MSEERLEKNEISARFPGAVFCNSYLQQQQPRPCRAQNRMSAVTTGAAEPGVRYGLKKVRGGGWRIIVTRGPASSSTTALAPLTRPRLAAPSTEIWRHGEDLRSSCSALKTLQSRELKIGGERCDIALPGQDDAFGESLQEYVPLLFCAIETNRIGTLRRLYWSWGSTPTVTSAVRRRSVVRQRLAGPSSCEFCTRTALTSTCHG